MCAVACATRRLSLPTTPSDLEAIARSSRGIFAPAALLPSAELRNAMAASLHGDICAMDDKAMRQSMLAMIDAAKSDAEADPRLWAPFVVVGEPAKVQ
jgi:hypothetical protein